MKQSFISVMSRKILFALFVSIVLISCSQSKYSNLVKEEMAKEVRYDSIFLGHTFGQTKQEFFDKCLKLNHQKKIKQGPKSSWVEYFLPSKPEDQKIRMLFYGIFNEDKIMTGMDMEFSYVAWSLWNESTQPEALKEAIKDSLLLWYPGNDFVKMHSKQLEGDILLKIDGNRRIIIEPIKDVKDVYVRIDDLRYKVD